MTKSPLMIMTIVAWCIAGPVALSQETEKSAPIKKDVSTGNNDFCYWSIPVKPIIEVKEPPPLVHLPGEIICRGARWPKNAFLTRPGEKNFVIVVQYEPGSPATLYPNGFDYGPLPRLQEMTRAQADLIFGKNIKTSQEGGWQTHRLTTAPYPQDYFLDLVFKSDQLLKYRVRTKTFEHFDILSSGPKLSDWQKIDR